ncbi:MAG TPA: prepilin peptidase [Blastocatellia bacterium]|nr:prepilin peptidase [Blastocatellia bacterium]
MESISAYIIGAFVFIFGLLIGSFLNVVIHRVPKKESIVFPGSHCPACNATIKPYDNIPVFSFAILGGKCRNCGASISPIYPAVELLVAVLFFLVFIKVGTQFQIFRIEYDQQPARFWLTLIADILFVSFIVPLVFIDFRYKLLPDAITYPGIFILVVMRMLAPDPWLLAHTPKFFGLGGKPDWLLSLVGSALGALVGGGSLWLVREAYYRLRHVEGMGQGDIKMMVMVGAYLGWHLTLLTIFIGSLLGSVIGIMLIARRRGSMKTELPFGVFLGPAAVIALFLGQSLITWYIGML